MIIHDRLREVLHYNPDTGIFTWINRTSSKSAERKQWVATITKDRKVTRLGRYKTRNEAASVYAETAWHLFGEFARTA